MAEGIERKTYASTPLISLDYAIKYLLKEESDFSIIEGFISAILETQGYKSIKIVAFLDTESNIENRDKKRRLADLVVEDEDKNRYIVEIERTVKDSFIHKSIFSVSRMIVDNMPKGFDYKEITKVFHIFLLYTKLGKGSVYHGKCIIHEVESNEKLVFCVEDDNGVKYNAADVFPEYFYISIPLFNDRIERDLDEWLHVLKHGKIPENYRSPLMEKVAERLNRLKMTREQEMEYICQQVKWVDERESHATARKEGREKGLEEGRKEKEEALEQAKREREEALGQAKKEKEEAIKKTEKESMKKVALNLLSQGVDIDTISKSTGLLVEELEELGYAYENE